MDLDDPLAVRGPHGLEEADAQDALGVADGAHRGVGDGVDAGCRKRCQGGVLGHENAGHGDVGAVGGGAVLGHDRRGRIVEEP